MKVQVQFTCPVGILVDTETGTVERVVVWNEHLSAQPAEAGRDEYIRFDHPEYAAEVEKQKVSRNRPLGVSVFEPLELDHPEVVKALQVIGAAGAGDVDWPTWELGA